MAVAWDAESAQVIPEVQIFCTDRTGMLANITRVCEQLKVNIQRVDAQNLGRIRRCVASVCRSGTLITCLS